MFVVYNIEPKLRIIILNAILDTRIFPTSAAMTLNHIFHSTSTCIVYLLSYIRVELCGSMKNVINRDHVYASLQH